MAFGALGGLAQGLAQGMQMGWNQQERERQAARQEKLDAQSEQLFNEKLDAIRDERETRENQKAIDRALADSGKAGQVEDAAAVTYTNPNGEQKTAYQPDQQTADFAAQQQRLEEGSQPAAPAVASNPTATTATSVRDLSGNRKLFTGLNAATDAKSFSDQNQPGSYAHYMAMRNKLMTMVGGQKAADEYLKRAKEAQSEGLFEALGALNANDPKAAKLATNATGKLKLADNQNFEPEVGADGKPTGKWNIVETAADGSKNVISQNIEGKLQQFLLGKESIHEAYKAGIARQTKLWEYQNDPTKRFKDTKPGGQIFDTKTGQYVASNETGYVPATDAAGNIIYDEDGEPRMVRAGAGGKGAGAGAGSKAGKTPDIIEKTLKGNEGGIATATGLYRSLLSNNPGMPDEEASSIAIRAAGGSNRRAVFNPATGQFDEYFDDKTQLDKDGKPTGFASNKSYLIQSHSYAKGGAIADKDAQGAVTQIQQAVPKEKFDAYVAAKSDAGYKAFVDNQSANFTELANKMKADVEAVRNDANMTPQQKQAKAEQIIAAASTAQEMMKADKRRMELVRQFYQAPGANNDGNKRPARGLFDTDYTPPADSPAGRSAARQAELKAANEKKAQDRLAAQQALSKQFQADLKTMPPLEVARKYQDSDLPTADLATLRNLKY